VGIKERPPPGVPDGGLSTSLDSGDRTRTCDPLINSQLLYQLSYAGPARKAAPRRSLINDRRVGVSTTAAVSPGALADRA
jgi:hypothetical protein